MRITVLALFLIAACAATSDAARYQLQAVHVNNTIKFPQIANCWHDSDTQMFIRNCPQTATFYLHAFNQFYKMEYPYPMKKELASAAGFYNRSTNTSTIIFQRNDTFHLFTTTQEKLQECTFNIRNFGEHEITSIHIILNHLVVRQPRQNYMYKSIKYLVQMCSSTNPNGTLELEFDQLDGIVENMFDYTHRITFLMPSFSRKDAIFFDKANHFVIINQFEEQPSNGTLEVSGQEFVSIDPNILPQDCWSQLSITHDSEASFLVIQCHLIQTVFILSLNPLIIVTYYQGANYGNFAFFNSLSSRSLIHGEFSSSLLCFQYGEFLGVRQYARLENPLRFNISEVVFFKLEGKILKALVEEEKTSNLTISLLFVSANHNDTVFLERKNLPFEFLYNEPKNLIKLADQTICTEHEKLCFSGQASKIATAFENGLQKFKPEESNEDLVNPSTTRWPLEWSPRHRRVNVSFAKQGCFESHLNFICSRSQANSDREHFRVLCEVCKQGQDSCFRYNQIFLALIQKNCKLFQGTVFLSTTSRGCLPYSWVIGDNNSIHGKRIVFQPPNAKGGICRFSFVLKKAEPTLINLKYANKNELINPLRITFEFYKVTDDGLLNRTSISNKSSLIFQDEPFAYVDIEVSGVEYLEFDILQSARADWNDSKKQFYCSMCSLNLLRSQKDHNRALVEYPAPIDECLLPESNRMPGTCQEVLNDEFCSLRHLESQNLYEIVFNSSFIMPICKLHLEIPSNRSWILLEFKVNQGDYVQFSDSDQFYEYLPQEEKYDKLVNTLTAGWPL